MDVSLNIAGSEWLIIVLAIMILLLGTNKFPEAARKLGKIASEYNKAKKEFTDQINDVKGVRPTKPVENEREKLDSMAQTLGITYKEVPDEELRKLIAEKVGERTKD